MVIKQNHVCTIGIPEGKEKKGKKLFEEIMPVKFPNLEKKRDICIQEAQRITNMFNLKRSAKQCIIIRMSSFKD